MEYHEGGTFQFCVVGVIGSLLVLLGLIGNSICIAVFSRPRMRSSINCILRCLAIFDIVVLVFWYLKYGWEALMTKIGFDETLVINNLTLQSMFLILIKVGYSGSVWSTVGVTIERYVAVCHPLKAKSICTYKRAQIWNVLSIVYVACNSTPDTVASAILNSIDWRRNESFNESQEFRKVKAINDKLTVIEISWWVEYWFQLFFLHVVPLISFVVFNTAMLKTFIISKRKRKESIRGYTRKDNLVLMLLCMVTITIVSNVFHVVFQIRGMVVENPFDDILFSSNKIMIATNSSANFFIYFYTCARFRKIVIKMSRKCNVQKTDKRLECRCIYNVELVDRADFNLYRNRKYCGHLHSSRYTQHSICKEFAH